MPLEPPFRRQPVTLTNVVTNVVTTTTTNEAGGYQFNALTPGRYTR